MIIPPFYSTPTDDEIVHHYKTVADAISLPIMVYNNPATANVDLKPPLVARLAEIDNCLYIKESTLEVTRVRDIIRLCGDRMTVFGGILGFESFVEGAQGWVAVASNVAPHAMARIFSLVADEGAIDTARKLYLDYLPLIEFVGGQAYVAGTKALLSHMGFAAGMPRPPRLPLPALQDAAARALVAKFGLAWPGAAAASRQIAG
jgi:4-hydroxy-tetrahydrodipicolinate synthase